MAGLGGALFVPQVGIVNPDSLGIVLGIQMVIWVAVGGRGTLFGAVFGHAGRATLPRPPSASRFRTSGSTVSAHCSLLSVLLFPGGLVGFLRAAGRLGRTTP